MYHTTGAGHHQWGHLIVKVLLKKQDITEKIISLSYSDFDQDNIDTLNLKALEIQASFSDKVELYVNNTFMGTFFVSDITINYKDSIELNCHSIDYSKGLKTKRSATLKGKLVDIIKDIALRNSLRHKINFKNQSKIVELVQFDKSDAQILDELAKSYNCSLSIKNHTLFFLDKGEVKRTLYSLRESEIITLSLKKTNKQNFNSVVATYHDLESGESKNIQFGKGEPVLNCYFISVANEEEAFQRAKESLKKSQFSNFEGKVRIKGKVIFAGSKLELTLDGKKKEFLITKVTHEFSPGSHECNLEFS